MGSLLPGSRPKVKKRNGKAAADTTSGIAGNYRASYDPRGADSAMVKTLSKRRPASVRNDPLAKLMRVFGVNID